MQVLFGIVFILFTGVGFAFFTGVRCTAMLMLPCGFSTTGQIFFASLAIVLIYEGKVENDVIDESMTMTSSNLTRFTRFTFIEKVNEHMKLIVDVLVRFLLRKISK